LPGPRVDQPLPGAGRVGPDGAQAMASDTVIHETADGCAILTLNRPKALNALSVDLIADLTQALDAADADPIVMAMVLTGGPRVFAAGADVADMVSMDAQDAFARDFSGCCDRMASVRKPVIAAVEGYALGGGCELVEMCDIVVASETAVFGHPEITLAAMPAAGGTQRLPRTVGKHKAMDLLLTGRRLSATDAERCGLVSRLTAPGEALDVARAIGGHLATLSLPALMMMKEAVRQAFDQPLSAGLAAGRRLVHLTFAMEDRREGMAAFLDKRKPAFRHC